MNKKSVELAADILGGATSPIILVSAGVGHSHDEVKNAVVAGVSGLQAMGASVSKGLSSIKIAGPVWCISALDDAVEIGKDLRLGRRVENEKILGPNLRHRLQSLGWQSRLPVQYAVLRYIRRNQRRSTVTNTSTEGRATTRYSAMVATMS